MLLNLDAEKPAEPWWFTVYPAVEADREEDCRPAVRVKFQPIGRIALREARRAAGEVLIAADLDDDETAPVPPQVVTASGDALSDALLMAGIIDWEGVGDADGNPVPVTPEGLRVFLSDPLRFEKLDNAYVRPWVMADLEKNGWSPSRNGTSAGAMPAKATAGKPARPNATGGARKTRAKG